MVSSSSNEYPPKLSTLSASAQFFKTCLAWDSVKAVELVADWVEEDSDELEFSTDELLSEESVSSLVEFAVVSLFWVINFCSV